MSILSTSRGARRGIFSAIAIGAALAVVTPMAANAAPFISRAEGRLLVATLAGQEITAIANLAGAPSPRMVGAILAEDGHDLPWHRILRANGTPAPHLVHDQLERLRAEGVLADGQRVDLRKYRWKPDGEEDTGPEGLF